MTTQVEFPVSTGANGLACKRDEEQFSITFTVPKGSRLPNKLSKMARKHHLVRSVTTRGRQLICELRPRSFITFDEIADKVEEKVMDKYNRNQQAYQPESNTERRRKERMLKQPALAKS